MSISGIFVEMHDDGKGSAVTVDSEEELRKAVITSMFCDGELTHPDHVSQVDGVVDNLREDGAQHFEGDASLYFIKTWEVEDE